MKPIKFAIMSFENGHCINLGSEIIKNPLCEVVAISIASGYKKNINISQYGKVPVYYDDEKMLNEHPEIEAAVLGSNNRRHIEQFRMCAKRGIHIISMKIPTFDMEEYDEMIKLKNENNIECLIELEMRLHAEIYKIKELCKEEKIGKILSFNAFNHSHNPFWWTPWIDLPEDSYGKRIELKPGDYRFRGGALSDHPHIFDLTRFILDSEFESVYAEAAPNLRKEAQTEDMVTVIGKMKNGVIFSLDPSFANKEKKLHVRKTSDFTKYPRAVEVELAIHGEKGSIIADVYGSRTIACSYMPNEDYKVFGAGVLCDNSREMLIKNFIKRIKTGEKSDLSLETHRPSIEAINYCYDSIQSGKIIKI